MWYLGRWFGGGLECVRAMVGFDDLRGPLQIKWLFDSDSRLDLAGFSSLIHTFGGMFSLSYVKNSSNEENKMGNRGLTERLSCIEHLLADLMLLSASSLRAKFNPILEIPIKLISPIGKKK